MKELKFRFNCPVKDECIFKDNCIFDQSTKLSERADLPRIIYQQERNKLKIIFRGYCKKKLKRYKDEKETLAFEIFRRYVERKP